MKKPMHDKDDIIKRASPAVEAAQTQLALGRVCHRTGAANAESSRKRSDDVGVELRAGIAHQFCSQSKSPWALSVR